MKDMELYLLLKFSKIAAGSRLLSKEYERRLDGFDIEKAINEMDSAEIKKGVIKYLESLKS